MGWFVVDLGGLWSEGDIEESAAEGTVNGCLTVRETLCSVE